MSCQFHAIATGKSLGSAGVVNQRPELQRLLKFMLSFPLKLASTLHNKPRSEPTAAGARLAGDVSLQELLRGRSRKNKDPVGCSADWVCAEGSKDWRDQSLAVPIEELHHY